VIKNRTDDFVAHIAKDIFPKKTQKIKKTPAFSYHNKNHLLKLFEKVNE
jgi:hypothetical protein